MRRECKHTRPCPSYSSCSTYCHAGEAGRSPVLPPCDQLGGPRHGVCEGKLETLLFRMEILTLI